MKKRNGITAVVLLTCALVMARSPEDDAVSEAIAAMNRGDLPSAEQVLRTRLHAQPKDGTALEVLGVVLDGEKKYAEADEAYRRALAISPRSPALLNNYGNHLIATGKLEEARKVFLQVAALNAGNANANVQLARIALGRKAATEAIGYLDRVPSDVKNRPDVALLRMQADYASGHIEEANAILARLSPTAQTDSGQSFTLGVALASVGQYAKAETFFSRTLETEPGNFEALYDLGLAASHAGHHERARAVLQQALERQPQNVDVLYDLAAVDFTLDQKESALELLARASKISPGRADVLQLLARISADLGYFADAIQAWNEYLKVTPNDDTARRERASAETAIGENAQAGLNELNSFVRKHPNDPLGHYELGVAQAPQHPDLALQEFERALAAKPDLLAAHIARGLLLYRQGKPEAALADFQFAVRRDPKNGALLDRLGEAYLALDRANDALPVLRQAAELMPSNSTVLLHLGRALAKTGHTEEANAVFARCRELGPDKSASPHPAGLVEFLSLSPAEQAAKYRAGVERTVRSNPANVEAQVRYLSILLDEGKTAEATAVAHKIASLQPTAPLLEQAARATLAAEQYGAAQELFQNNEVSAHGPPDLSLDRAIADFYAVNAKAGLEEMDRIPQSERKGDYYLARAQMLAAQNQWQDAKLALQEALQAHPTRPELYRQTAVLLIKNQHAAEALQLLDGAARNLPDNPDLLLLRAMALALTGNGNGADRELKKLETRKPDWYKVWLVDALILESQGQSEEARSLRQTAITLGAPAGVTNLMDALAVLFH